MEKSFDLEQYLNSGVENIVKGALRAAFTNPKESAFLAKYAIHSKKAGKIRKKFKKQGEHIPPFLIASITSRCNLNCTGCYARANHSCGESVQDEQLSRAEWGSIFYEAEELGIGFILLAGGEPLLRQDVIEEAATHSDILFPIFTNGTIIRGQYISLFAEHRNLVPILSIEGDVEITDSRRGAGIYAQIMEAMELLQYTNIFYGTAITVTKHNLQNVTSDAFLSTLHEKGCKTVIYVEYVPVDEATAEWVPTKTERRFLADRLQELRNRPWKMVFISFPGDEKASGGCLAAGRGFFHINAHGGAEPCPFSPYSDTNLRVISLRNALNSPLFMKLNSKDVLQQDHEGGCVLFEKEQTVRQLLAD